MFNFDLRCKRLDSVEDAIFKRNVRIQRREAYEKLHFYVSYFI